MQDAEALILGLGLFATGGGGLAARGRGYLRALLDDGIEVTWTPVENLDPQTVTCSVYGMGSIAPHPTMTGEEMVAFGVDGERYARPWLRAIAELESHLSTPIGAVIPFELGPSNSLVAVDTAARTGRALIDGDYIGRALPKMSQALPAVNGLATWPLAVADPWGNCLIMKDCPSNEVAERVGKMISRVTKAVDMNASCSHAGFPLRAEQVAENIIEGTLSRSQAAGREVLAARAAGADAVEAARQAVGGVLLFRGTVSERDWKDTPDGYMEGTNTIAGEGEFASESLDIWFLNEHHIVRRDHTVVATSPDIVAVVRADDAEPISNTELDRGMRVAVLGFKAPAVYRAAPALALNEPRYYGFDLDYQPIEELNPGGAW